MDKTRFWLQIVTLLLLIAIGSVQVYLYSLQKKMRDLQNKRIERIERVVFDLEKKD